jgi:hypothetical protein
MTFKAVTVSVFWLRKFHPLFVSWISRKSIQAWSFNRTVTTEAPFQGTVTQIWLAGKTGDSVIFVQLA